MKVELIKEDFIGADYDNPCGCPLWHCLNRLGYKNHSIGGTVIDIEGYGNDTHRLPKHWNSTLVSSLTKDAENGINVNYTLNLKPIENA